MNKQRQVNILMFNMQKYADWQDGLYNRNYHILHSLAKNEQVNKIIAVDFLPFTWQKALKTFIKDQIIRDTRGEIVFGNLASRCWQISSKILVYSTIHSVLNTQKIQREINQVISDQKLQHNLIVWNYNPIFIDYFNNFDQDLNIFDAVDNWIEHPSYQDIKDMLVNNYNFIKKKSDLIFTVSNYLKINLFDNLEKVKQVPNAVNLEYFKQITEIHPKLKKIHKPIIGFLGILENRIDIDILTYLAKNNPEKSIVLAGPVWKTFPKDVFSQFSNIHFLGLIKGKEIPSLYNGFDVGIIPYKLNKFIKSTDPMKYYEYLAADLPVVSTPTPDIDKFNNLIIKASTPEKFHLAVNQVLKQDINILQSTRQMFISSHTWQNRTDQMLALINEKLFNLAI